MKVFRSFVTMLAVAVMCSGLAHAENPKNIIFYGNSFTLGVGSSEAVSYGGVPEVVKQLAVAAGYAEPRVENAAVSGQSLEWHLANNTGSITNPADFTEAPDFQWDAVVMQEYSTKPTHIGDPMAFQGDAITMLGLVLAHSPGAKGVLYETWARGPGHSYYTGATPTFPGGPAQMQQELRDNYETAEEYLNAAYGDGSAALARVGDAWEATGWDDLHAGDIYHANSRGTYLAGLVIFATVYGERSTEGLPSLFASMTAQEAADLQAVADDYLAQGLTFDDDGDHDIDAADVPGFVDCLMGPQFSYAPGADCLLMDGNEDDHVDLVDFALMQAAVFTLPTTLTFDTWDITFTLNEGTATDSQPNTVTADDGSLPTVQLSAVDLNTSGAPTWLTIPASIGAGVAFDVDVDVTGLAAGVYYARVYGSATGYETASFTVTLNVSPVSGGQTIYVDFGDIGQLTAGNYNNITHEQNPVPNAIDDAGIGTGISITITDAFWPGSNQSGTTSPTGDATLFDAQATRDNLFGNTVSFGGFTEPTGGFTLAGMSTTPGVTYSFTFFGARLGVSDNRETAFAIVGSNSDTGYLDPANNQSEIVTVANIAADTNGEIVVTVGPGPNNNNSSGFYYLGAMQIVRNDP